MRVGLVVYDALAAVSGGNLYDRQLVDYLEGQGDRVEMISLPRRGYARNLLDNASAELVRRMRGDYDVLLQDELVHPSLAWANRRLGRGRPPIVAIVHHLRASEPRPPWRNRFYRAVERRYLRTVDAFIYNSRTTHAAVEGLLGLERPHVVAYPGGDRLAPTVDEATAAKWVGDGPLRLLFVGNLIPRKGLHVLLAALARAGGDWRLSVVGSPAADPCYAEAMRRRAARTGLNERIAWCGGLSDTELAAEMTAAHALVVPSEYEGFGIVYLEGMGFGLPAIGTTAGAAEEIIAGGENGFLVPPGDAAALIGCIEALAGDRALLARLGAAALVRYRLQPTWEQTTATIRAFLMNVTGARD